MSVWSSLEGVVVLKAEKRISVKDLIYQYLGDDEVSYSIDRMNIDTVKFHITVCLEGEQASKSLTMLCKALEDSCYQVELDMHVRW